MAYEPRPPSSRSARSASSRNNLVLRQQHEQMKSQILKDMQMTSKKGGRHMDASAFKEMQAVASEEAARVMGAGAGAVPAMPKELLARARQLALLLRRLLFRQHPLLGVVGRLRGTNFATAKNVSGPMTC